MIQTAFSRYDVSLGAGLGELAGKVFRIGHLGDMNPLTLAGALSGVEMALADVGVPITLGSGIGAALTTWRTSSRVPDRRVNELSFSSVSPIKSGVVGLAKEEGQCLEEGVGF